MGAACISTSQIPVLEQKWCSIVASIKRRAEAKTVVVNLVAENGRQIDRDEYNAQVIADYLLSIEQGNKEGSAL